MDGISNEERLKRIAMDVAAVIGVAERGDPELVQENMEELTALFVQVAASYAAVATTIGMHPSSTSERVIGLSLRHHSQTIFARPCRVSSSGPRSP